MPNDDAFVWIGASGGSWDDPNNWEDVTTGQDPATSYPGITDTVTITGTSGSVYELIDGGGAAASLVVAGGLVDLAGSYDAAVLTIGATSGPAGGVIVSAGSTLSTGTAAVVNDVVSVAGGGALFSVAGALSIGVASRPDQAEPGSIAIGADATLDAQAPLVVNDGLLSVSGGAAVATLSGGLTLGAFGTYGPGFDSGDDLGDGTLSVGAGATVAVVGTIDTVDGAIEASGTAAVLTASGDLILGITADVQAVSGASMIFGGVLAEPPPDGYDLAATIYVDGTSRIEIGTEATGAVGALTIDPGATLTSTKNLSLDGGVVDDGLAFESGATLEIGLAGLDLPVVSSLSGNGTIELGPGAALVLNAAAAASETIAFGGTDDMLAIGAAETLVDDDGTFIASYADYAVEATLAGFALGDTITLAEVSLTGVTYTATGADLGTLALFSGAAEIANLTLSGDYAGQRFLSVPTTGNGSAVVLLASGGTGTGPVSTTTDSFVWIGSSGGAWNDAANWEDVTTGQDPATSYPGITDTVTITGTSGSVYELIDGGGAAASLVVAGGFVDLVGSYDAEVLTIGATSGPAGGVIVSAGSTLSTGTAAVVNDVVSVAGGGALFSVVGALSIGVAPRPNQAEPGSIAIGADATLDAQAPLVVNDGLLSVSGVATLSDGLTLGAFGTYGSGFDSGDDLGDGTLSVGAGATVVVTGTIDAVDGAIEVSGTAAVLTASGDLILGITADVQAVSGASMTFGGVLAEPPPDGYDLGATIYVDGTSRIEIGTDGTGPAGALTIDPGATLTSTNNLSLDGSVVDDGLVFESGATLEIGLAGLDLPVVSSVSGNGTIELGPGAALVLNAAAAASETIVFGGTDDMLAIGAAETLVDDDGTFIASYADYAVEATLAGFALGDTVTLAEVSLTGVTYTATGADLGTLALFSGAAEIASLTLAGDYAGQRFLSVPTTGNGSAVVLLASSGTGTGPVSTTTDSFVWIGSSGGAWNDAANWEDVTTGQDPATSYPGITDTVTITGTSGSVYELIDGGGAAASLVVAGGFVDLAGSYDAAVLMIGATSGPAGGVIVSAGSTLSTGTAAVVNDVVSVAGGGALFSVAGALSIGVAPRPNQAEPGSIAIGADAILDAQAPLVVNDGLLSVSGVANLSDGLTLGAFGTYGSGDDLGDGTLSVGAGATVAVAGTIDAVDGALSALGTGAVLTASGDVILGITADVQAVSGASMTFGGVLAGPPPDGYDLGATIYVDGTSRIEIGTNSTGAVGALTIDPGATLASTNNLSLDGSVVADGLVFESGATLEIGLAGLDLPVVSSVSGNGTIELGPGAALVLNAAAAASETIAFDGTDDMLAIGAAETLIDDGTSSVFSEAYAVEASLHGFATGDSLMLSDETLTNALYSSTGNNEGTLDLIAGTSSVGTLQLAGDYTGRTFAVEPTTNGSSAVTLDAAVACYLAGTRISTERGETPVQDLAIGDRVVAAGGAARPIRWIGRRSYDRRFIGGNRGVLPILICAGALADGVPTRDLRVSPKHAMFLDGVLVPAELLVNGRTIRQVDDIAVVQYFHVELDSHDVVLAEGAWSETFVDCDSRTMFQNAGEFAALFPDRLSPRWDCCAPRIESGRVLEDVRRRLATRAGLVGCHEEDAGEPGLVEGRVDVANNLEVSGWVCDSARPHTKLAVEIRVGGAVVASIVANEARPDLEVVGKGAGRCAFSHRFAEPMAYDASHVISVRLAASHSIERIVPAARETGRKGPGPLEGRIDICDEKSIEGWAIDCAWPERPVVLEVLRDDVVIGGVTASCYRPDLAAAGIGDGRRAYRFSLEAFDVRGAVVTVRRVSDGAVLGQAEHRPLLAAVAA